MHPEHEIRDISLAPAGEKKISWAADHMIVLRRIAQEFEKSKPFAGHTVAMCLHLEAKTACLARAIKSGGASVYMCASNPLSTQDDVVAALVDNGIGVFAVHGSTTEDYSSYIKMTLARSPDLLIDDGADMVAAVHAGEGPNPEEIIGGCEETTTGINRLKAMHRRGQLKFPVIAVNDARCKYLFDNRYGTGQSVWDGINRSTNLVVAGKTVVVIGYGWCGKGVTMRAKGLGARVIVCEVDPVRANEALMDGCSVMPLIEAAPQGDYFITVTGDFGLIGSKHYAVMKDGAILANAGHFDVEIDIQALSVAALSHRTVRKNVEEYLFADGRKLFLLGEGRLVNLAAGDGHPVEIMDMSFSLQALSARFLLETDGLSPGVLPVPTEIDALVAKTRLDALGIEIDTLTQKQKEYLDSV